MKLWIARDKCGDLGLYGSRPTLSVTATTWNKVYCSFISINSGLFPEVTFENSPKEIEFKLVK